MGHGTATRGIGPGTGPGRGAASGSWRRPVDERGSPFGSVVDEGSCPCSRTGLSAASGLHPVNGVLINMSFAPRFATPGGTGATNQYLFVHLPIVAKLADSLLGYQFAFADCIDPVAETRLPSGAALAGRTSWPSTTTRTVERAIARSRSLFIRFRRIESGPPDHAVRHLSRRFRLRHQIQKRRSCLARRTRRSRSR